jgi:hypothetical protein
MYTHLRNRKQSKLGLGHINEPCEYPKVVALFGWSIEVIVH